MILVVFVAFCNLEIELWQIMLPIKLGWISNSSQNSSEFFWFMISNLTEVDSRIQHFVDWKMFNFVKFDQT
jgi:hypothetical protein